MDNEPVSPSTCKHRGALFIYSFRSAEYRSHVSLCPLCGTFSVLVDFGQDATHLTFHLASDEELQAAGQYIRYITRPNTAST